MTLTPQDLAVQEKILLAVHKWCTIEEAKYKESKLERCVLKFSKWDGSGMQEGYYSIASLTYQMTDIHQWCYSLFYVRSSHREIFKIHTNYWYKIVWLPPTLSRVLIALGDSFWYWRSWYIVEFWKISHHSRCWRKLLNDDWTDATLRDQSQETKEKVAELLGVK